MSLILHNFLREQGTFQLVVTNFDLSSYTNGAELGEEDIIELAVTLAKVNRLRELGELPKIVQKPLTDGQLGLIKRILLKFESKREQETISSVEILKQRLASLENEVSGS